MSNPRRAVMVVWRNGRHMLAQAVENEPGYWPLPAFGTFRLACDALVVADRVNAKNGLTDADAQHVINSAPRREALADPTSEAA